jgi:hypothetical protein
MSGTSASKPNTLPAAEGQVRLKAAGFTRLFIVTPPNPCELWQNRHRKTVQIQYSDTSYEWYWEETIDEALKHQDAHPKNPSG